MIPSYLEDKDILEVKKERAWHSSPHIHRSLEIVYVTEGTMELSVGADLFYLGKGDLALTFPGLIHSCKEVVSEKCSCLTILVSPSFFGSYEDRLRMQRAVNPVIKSKDLHADVLYVLSALEESSAPDNKDASRHQNSFLHVWIQVILSRCIPLMELQPRKDFQDYNLVSEIVTFVATHYRENLSLQQVAKEVGVSRYVLSRIFSNDFHQNFNHYVNSVRLEHATALLTESKEPIKKIMTDCGFKSSVTFNRVFVELYHLTPRQYRQKHQIT